MAKAKEKTCRCCGRFPTCAILILVLGLLWFFADLGWIAIDLPWLPMIIIIFSICLLFKHKHMK